MNKNIIIAILVALLATGLYLYYMSDARTGMIEGEITMGSSDYQGMTVKQAEATAQANQVDFRVVEIDGAMQPTTKDFKEGRVSAKVENGIVVDYSVETRNANPSPQLAVDDYDQFIGMTTVDAEIFAEVNNVPFRIGVVDGEGLPVTLDYIEGRVTAEVEDGIVTGFSIE